MAGGGPTGGSGVTIENQGNKKYGLALTLMVSLFFMIGFITVLNDVLIPSLKGLFELSPSQAMLIQFCFFIAYAIMSFPAGMIIDKIGYKKGLILALGIMAAGLLLFVAASMVGVYGVFLFALFVVASGVTVLQVAINPYIIALGPEETGAARLNLGGALNSTATFVGPIIGGAFILKDFHLSDFADLAALNVAKADAVRGPYIVLALVTVSIAAVLYFMQLPKIQNAEEKAVDDGTSAWDFMHLKLGAGAIFFYVGAEVAIGSLLILYLVDNNLIVLPAELMATIDAEDLAGTTEKMASSLLAYYWGSAMIGRFIGSALGKYVKANKMLATVSVVAMALIIVSMMGFGISSRMDVSVIVLNTSPFDLHMQSINIPVSAFLLVLVGLFNSVMWPSIFPLGIAKLGKHTSKGSGIMVTMVLGGAVIPYLQGLICTEGNFDSYRYSFIVALVCYVYLLFFALKGYKMGKVSKMIDED